ncbi:MAG: phage major capsid protein [Chthoniobacteraceae bacterium]
MNKTLIPFLSILSALAPAVSAAGQETAEAKLREGLRNAMLQARGLQAERDTLQAEKTQLEQEKKTALEQAEALQKQMTADKDASDKAVSDLKEKVENQGAQIVELKSTLEKWKAAHAEVTGIAQKKEGERAKLAQEKIELERVMADQQRKNLAMYRIGMDILNRYEKFGLGTALSAREPFTGLMRVKLENLVQDYGDKLAGERIKPDPTQDAAAARQARKARSEQKSKAQTDKKR